MAKKTVSKKTSAKAAAAPKKTSAPKKPVAKKVAKPAAAAKKPASKKAPANKAAAKKAPAKKAATPSKKSAPAKKPVKTTKKAVRKTPVTKKKSAKDTPPAGKGAAKKATPVKKEAKKSSRSAKKPEPAPAKATGITASPVPRSQSVTRGDRKRASQVVFTMEDVRAFLREQARENAQKDLEITRSESGTKPSKGTSAAKAEQIPSRPKQVFGAASIADILGFDPTRQKKKNTAEYDEKNIPKKFLPYYKALMKIRSEVADGLDRHSKETLLRSNREDSGDLASFGQHLADASSESYERDFALSQVSSEQEALYEIDQAIQRIKDGSYGVCEITGQTIKADRLKAVPFTRYSVEGQMEVEKNRRRSTQRTGLFSGDTEDGALFTAEDFEE